MPSVAELKEMIDAGLGRAPLDMVVRNGRLVNVFTGEIYPADVGIKAGYFVRVGDLAGTATGQSTTVVDAQGGSLIPGFFDPHFHAGGCHLSPTQLARALLARGTTSTVCDFQEHYVVSGVEAARFALDEAWRAGLKAFYLVPIHMFVVEGLGVSGSGMRVEHMLEMLEWPETVAINEPPPGQVLSKREDALQVIEGAHRLRLVYSGHAPEVSGAMLQTYLATGASSDHESGRKDEAMDKLRLGMRTIMRMGSAAPDMPNLLPMAQEHPQATRHMMFGTDEVDPIDLVAQGHMDYKVRLAIASGVPPATAIQMATINPAQYYRVDDRIGSITPGRVADLVILRDLERVEIATVVANGRVVVRDGEFTGDQAEVSYPEAVLSKVIYGRELAAKDFAIPAPEGAQEARVRVVGVVDGSLVSEPRVHTVKVEGGALQPDRGADVLKMAVIDRYSGTGEMGLAFVQGFGFKQGAVATTYCHPYYNVLVVGTNDADMALAANRIAQLGGGIVIAAGGDIVSEWALPIVGIFSTDPLAQVRDNFVRMNNALRELGCTFKAPVLALSFVALVTIPTYGLTSKGLYDVVHGQFVNLLAEG